MTWIDAKQRAIKKNQVGVKVTPPDKLTTDADRSPLQLSINGRRVLIGTISFAALLAFITTVFLRGVELITLDASELSDEDRHLMLDRYNSYSGSLAAIVSIPFQQLPGLVLPVFFLSFTTHAVMTERKTWVMKVGPVVSVIAASYLLGLGLNSLNVQFDPPRVEFNIVTSDIMSPQADTSKFSDFSYVTSTTHNAGVPSTDTLMRSAITPSIQVNSAITCTDPTNFLYGKPEASIRYGFPIQSWFYSFLSKSVASTKSLTFSMADDFTLQSVDMTQFRSGSIRKTAVLMASAFYMVVTQFVNPSVESDLPPLAFNLKETINSPDAASLFANLQRTIANVTSMIELSTTPNQFTLSFKTSSIAIELSTYQLSPQIAFDAVTFDLPTLSIYDAPWFTTRSSDCTDRGCILVFPNLAGSNQDQVRLIPWCAGEDEWDVDEMAVPPGECTRMSNSSVLIYSLARRIVTEEGVVDITNGTLSLKNFQITYRVTVGRLSWTTEDFSTVYGSTCAQGVNCRGLYFPLDDGKHHLVLGEDYIPVPQSPSTFFAAQRQVLAMANTQITSDTRGDIVTYRLSKASVALYNQTRLQRAQCKVLLCSYVNDIIERHIYSFDPVQPAYTAALFWLFQNAAVKELATNVSTNSTKSRLLFDGNRQLVSVHASIPFASACLTFVGCAIMITIGLMISWSSRSQVHQTSLASKIAAHNVSAVLTDTKQFPPLLVSVGIQQELNAAKSGTKRGKALDPIDRFEIMQTTITFRDRLDMSVRDVVVGNRKSS